MFATIELQKQAAADRYYHQLHLKPWVIHTYADALSSDQGAVGSAVPISGSLSSMSGVQAVLDGPPGGLLGRLDLPGEVLHQPPQQLRLDLEPIFAAARRGGVGDMLDDCCHKPEAELAGICGGALHLSRLVGAIRICLVSAGQKLAFYCQIERRLRRG